MRNAWRGVVVNETISVAGSETTETGVSIIVPHFNRAELLAETVASILSQSCSDWEIIIVDDGSTADQFKLVRAMASDRILVLQRIDGLKGPSRCRNIGAAAASRHYVMFVDSDDVLAPWCLEERLACFRARPDVAFCVFPVMLFLKTVGDTNRLWNRLDGDGDPERFLRSDPPWHTSSPLWSRSAFRSTGGFNECVMYGDDADLHARALLSGTPYYKAIGACPDLFVRRADEARITNTFSDALLDSRAVRLEQGSVTLKSAGSKEQCRIWEGQYFVEAEFLLFNVPGSKDRQRSVLAAWKGQWNPGPFRSFVVHAYIGIAQLTKNHGYLVLRLARRIAMLFLPKPFFPAQGSFEKATLSASQEQDLHQRLSGRRF